MKSVVRLTDHPDMTLAVYRGRKTTTTTSEHTQKTFHSLLTFCFVLFSVCLLFIFILFFFHVKMEDRKNVSEKFTSNFDMF